MWYIKTDLESDLNYFTGRPKERDVYTKCECSTYNRFSRRCDKCQFSKNEKDTIIIINYYE